MYGIYLASFRDYVIIHLGSTTQYLRKQTKLIAMLRSLVTICHHIYFEILWPIYCWPVVYINVPVYIAIYNTRFPNDLLVHHWENRWTYVYCAVFQFILFINPGVDITTSLSLSIYLLHFNHTYYVEDIIEL